MIRTLLSLLPAVLLISAGCGSDKTTDTGCGELTPEIADDCIRMNEIQVLGTHNSYKQAPARALVELLDAERPGWADNILYEHRPLTEQLAKLGMRQLELDIFADPEGRRYARPAGAVLINDETFLNRPEMMRPGFKVLHSQDVDYRTTCLTFTGCLAEVRDWSLAHPRHLPVLILVEVKDRPMEDAGPISFVEPVPFDEGLMEQIDGEIRGVFDEGHIITPDEVRGEFDSLEEAVLTRGWPTLAQTRGRLFFALDNTGAHREAYLAGAPDLSGRLLFVSSGPDEPTAAFIKMNNAIDGYDQIRERVEAGYLIRTRADLPLQEARSGDTTRLEAALKSGAQYISTDFPEPGPFGSGYQAALPGTEGVARCNPVEAPSGCQNRFLSE